MSETNEGSPKPDNIEHESPESLDLSKLNFAQFKETYENISKLAETTFEQTENGFINAKGNGIFVRLEFGIYRISDISDKLQAFHRFITSNPNSVLVKGTPDKEKMMQALRDMINEIDYDGIKYRIIE